MRIGNHQIGDGYPVYIIAEIGINHNGDIEQALKLIAAAKDAGCDAVKFQKRTPELCVPLEQRDIMRDTPWGKMTYFEYRKRVELGFSEYSAIDDYCKSINIAWFVSCWDEQAIGFISQFILPCYKVASASLTDYSLLKMLSWIIKPIILSTGMSTIEQIDRAVEILGKDDLILMHCTSTYPAWNTELNLRCIPMLKERYGVPVGYSGHELGIASTVAAVALGACMIERHITLDRKMWGSDQAASLEPDEFAELVRDIRFVEAALGDGIKRVYEREIPIMQRLRRIHATIK